MAPAVCPYCRNTVEPMRDAAGALVCPMCANTGVVRAPAQPAWAPTQPAWPAQAPYGGGAPAPTRTSGKAIAALILGIVTFVPLVGILTFIPAFVLGGLALREIGRSNGAVTGKGMAIAGIAVAAFASIIVVASVVFVLVSNLSAGNAGGVDEDALVHVNSPSQGSIYATLIRAGAHAPYSIDTGEANVWVDGAVCSFDVGSGARPGLRDTNDNRAWDVGEMVLLTTDCSGKPLASGSQHIVTVELHGTTLHNAPVVVQ